MRSHKDGRRCRAPGRLPRPPTSSPGDFSQQGRSFSRRHRGGHCSGSDSDFGGTGGGWNTLFLRTGEGSSPGRGDLPFHQRVLCVPRALFRRRHGRGGARPCSRATAVAAAGVAAAVPSSATAVLAWLSAKAAHSTAVTTVDVAAAVLSMAYAPASATDAVATAAVAATAAACICRTILSIIAQLAGLLPSKPTGAPPVAQTADAAAAARHCGKRFSRTSSRPPVTGGCCLTAGAHSWPLPSPSVSRGPSWCPTKAPAKMLSRFGLMLNASDRLRAQYMSNVTAVMATDAAVTRAYGGVGAIGDCGRGWRAVVALGESLVVGGWGSGGSAPMSFSSSRSTQIQRSSIRRR